MAGNAQCCMVQLPEHAQAEVSACDADRFAMAGMAPLRFIVLEICIPFESFRMLLMLRQERDRAASDPQVVWKHACM